jgi:16S rRNA (cytosine1402-N4)-methyltransferase
MSDKGYHQSVLLREAIEGLAIADHAAGNNTCRFVDATLGGGGHSRAILAQLSAEDKLFAFDQDDDALNQAPQDSRLTIIHQNFRYLKKFLRVHGALPVHGILADLGLSSHQIDEYSRGFSTRSANPNDASNPENNLDMRMDRRTQLDAREILATYSEGELWRIFQDFGELPRSKALAKKIVEFRKETPIDNAQQLNTLAKSFAPERNRNKYLAQLYQALRMEVNDEVAALKDFLVQAAECLAPGGRLVVISYHSGEDRLVKRFMQHGNFTGEAQKDFYGNPIRDLEPVGRKPMIPGEEEIKSNPRARSARLRIARKIINTNESK